MKTISIDIWLPEDGSLYMATSPQFKGLSAFGYTEVEALKECSIALQGFMEVYEEDGDDLSHIKDK